MAVWIADNNECSDDLISILWKTPAKDRIIVYNLTTPVKYGHKQKFYPANVPVTTDQAGVL